MSKTVIWLSKKATDNLLTKLTKVAGWMIN